MSQALLAKGHALTALKADDATAGTIKARIVAGQPAVALKMHGQDLLGWSAQPGALADVGAFKGAAQWKAALPTALLPFMVDGAAASWAEFNAAAPKFRAAGIVPLALGGQDWQEGTLFESVALGIGGADFYRAALVANDPAALQGPQMLAVFRQMRLLSQMVDPAYDNRSWSDTAALVARGDAAMQIMGEWVKSEFLLAGLRPERDFLCFPAPGTKGSFVFLSDFIGVFHARDAAARDAAEALVEVVMSKAVQEQFNLSKGSIPARLDVGGAAFDACAQGAMADRREAIRDNTMLGSLTYQHATTDAVKDVIIGVVHAHFHSAMSDAEAVRQVAEKVRAAKGG